MPCDSSHMEPDGLELESSRVRELLREVAGKPFNHRNRAEVYGNVSTLDGDTARLCDFCMTHNVSKYSLELQIWWRDHHAADEEKARQGEEKVRLEGVRRAALNKLTPEERDALKLP